MLVDVAGYQLGCDDVSNGGVRETEAGFEVIATKMTQTCDPIVMTRYRFGVSREGEVTVIDSEVAYVETGVCL